jgi:hypothetical protein
MPVYLVFATFAGIQDSVKGITQTLFVPVVFALVIPVRIFLNGPHRYPSRSHR